LVWQVAAVQVVADLLRELGQEKTEEFIMISIEHSLA
jgi:hypothetical protein